MTEAEQARVRAWGRCVSDTLLEAGLMREGTDGPYPTDPDGTLGASSARAIRTGSR